MSDEISYLEKELYKLIRDDQSIFEFLKSETLFRTLAELAPVGIYLTTPEGYCQYVNPCWCKMAGMNFEKALGEGWRNGIHPDDRALFFSKWEQMVASEGQWEMEYRFQTPAGKNTWVYGLAGPQRSAEGKIIGYVGINSDITERKKAEKAVIESEKKWRGILMKIPQIGISIDPQAKIIFANEHFLKITGWKREDVIGRDWFDLFIPDGIRKKTKAVFHDTLIVKTNVDFSTYENEILTKSGGILNISWSNVVNKDAAGNVLDLTCFGLDLTERVMAEKKIQKMAKRLELATRAARLGIFDWDIQNKRLIWDDRMYQLYGIKKQVFSNAYEAWLNGLHPDDRAENDRISEQAIQGEKEYDTEFRIIRPDGSIRFIKALGQVIWNSGGLPTRMTGINYDITEKKEMEISIQQSRKMEAIGTLASGIAHDFNNILFPIVGYTEMLLEDISDDSPLRDSLNEIYSGALRARDLVQQILAFSRQGKNELKLMRLQPIITQALKLTRSTIPTTISINQNLQPECGPVEADPTQIHQIVMNLTTNAYHAMEENGGELKVSLKEIKLSQNSLMKPDMIPGFYACLTVADTGTGMDKRVIDKIYEPFFTTKEKGKGTGMGLSVVHGIVKSMNGAIQVHSEPGNGTEFYIFLPIAKSTYKKQEIQANEPIQFGTERVLLVDDEKSIIMMERQILERLGYHVISCEDSMEALETFRANQDQFDLVITDMSMPKMPGDKLAAEILSIKPEIPIIICTGFSEKVNKEHAENIGVKGFLMKPVVKSDMAQMIRKVLDEANIS